MKAIRDRLIRRPSHATIVAYLALFVAIGGTGYAAATIGSAQIKNGSIRGKDIRRGTITGREVSERRLNVAGLRTYVVRKQIAANPFGPETSVAVKCRRGDYVAGGGGTASSSSSSYIVGSYPLPDLDGWNLIANVALDAPPSRLVGVEAVCIQRPR